MIHMTVRRCVESDALTKLIVTQMHFVELRKFDPPLWHAPYGRIV